jgi:predicted NUDIX family NTP pyrophosphohydrolase
MTSAYRERYHGLEAGILMYRWTGPRLEVLLVHPGGPFWRKKDEGAWSIPKGEMGEGEDTEVAARREFTHNRRKAAVHCYGSPVILWGNR